MKSNVCDVKTISSIFSAPPNVPLNLCGYSAVSNTAIRRNEPVKRNKPAQAAREHIGTDARCTKSGKCR
jgi:hypothetical protein